MHTNPITKIAVYCDHWQNGGVEAYLMNLFRYWDFAKLPCELVVSQMETDLYDAELATLGVVRRVTLAKRYRSPIRRILSNLSAMHHLLATGGYTAIYFNLSNSFTMIYAWMAKRAGIPVRVVHSHCAGIRPGVTFPIKMMAHRMGRFLFKPSVTDFLACSELAGRWMFGEELFQSGKVKLINNAVNTKAFTMQPDERIRIRAELGIKDKWVVGTVGRFAEQKNPFFLLDAFRQLTQIRPDAFLLWVGEGELMDSIQKRAQEFGITDKVLFFGTTNHVASYLWAMDVFCLPSRFEGLSIVSVEAQAAGCMCLISDRVTAQCKVSDNVRFLSIDQGVEPWVAAMQNAKRVCEPKEAAQQVAQNGFDAGATSIAVQALLLDAVQHAEGSQEVAY